MSKALIRSMNRRGAQSDKTPPVGRKQVFSDPSICDLCGAVYTGKSWRRGPRVAREILDKAKWVACPGCAQARSGEYHGRVLIETSDVTDPQAITARVANVEQRALVTQPERRIVSTNWSGNTFQVLTTSQKLAHRITREIEKAFGAKTHYSWASDGQLFATVKIAARHVKEKNK